MKKLFMFLWLSIASFATCSAYTTTESETLKVWYEIPTIIADGETVNYIKVFEHDNIDYTAFNMVFVFPEGLRINKVKQGREMVDDIFLTERASDSHNIMCKMQDDGKTLKIIANSMQNQELYPDDESGNPLDELFTVGLIADADMLSGTYEVYLTDIKFVLKNVDACVPKDDKIYGTMVVESQNVTQIDIIETDWTEIVGDCYDLQGRKVNPQKCIGSIVLYNGKKVMLK